MRLIPALRWGPIAVLLSIGTFAVAACTTPTSPSSTDSGGGSGGGSGGTGSGSVGMATLNINITDSPFSEADAVLVTFNEVSVHRSGSGWETLPFAGGFGERTCDLKKLQGPTDLLGVGSLPPGHYTQIRLHVDEARIFFDNASVGPACAPAITPPAGDSADVKVPSGEVKLNRQFTLTSGATTTILLDFDGDKSIKQTGGGNSGGNGNGNSNGRGNNPSDDDDDELGSYMMTPVIGVVSVQ